LISERFISEMQHFQGLINSLYERTIREIFEKSMAQLIETLRMISRFMSESLSSGKDDKCLEDDSY